MKTFFKKLIAIIMTFIFVFLFNISTGASNLTDTAERRTGDESFSSDICVWVEGTKFYTDMSHYRLGNSGISLERYVPEEPEEEPGDIWFDYLSVEFEVYGEGVSKYTNISSGNLFWGGELYASNTGFSYLSGYAVTEVSSYVVAEAENTTAIVVDLITTVEISW